MAKRYRIELHDHKIDKKLVVATHPNRHRRDGVPPLVTRVRAPRVLVASLFQPSQKK